MTEGHAAINRAVISLYDTQLYGLFYDNTAFHNRLTQAVLEETYAQLSPHEAELTEPKQEDDDFSDIDPEWLRARLAEHGIVNGEVVDPEKLAQTNRALVDSCADRFGADSVKSIALKFNVFKDIDLEIYRRILQ